MKTLEKGEKETVNDFPVMVALSTFLVIHYHLLCIATRSLVYSRAIYLPPACCYLKIVSINHFPH